MAEGKWRMIYWFVATNRNCNGLHTSLRPQKEIYDKDGGLTLAPVANNFGSKLSHNFVDDVILCPPHSQHNWRIYNKS